MNNFDNNFDDLVNNDKLDIFAIEDLLIKNIDEYKQQLQHHIEELLQRKVNENKIVIKKRMAKSWI